MADRFHLAKNLAELATIRQASLTANTVYELTQDFMSMLRHREGERLDTWLEHVRNSQICELQRIVHSIERDKAVVLAGLTLPHSNGVSDYCYSTEMGRAITRHNEGSAQVIPILLRSTFWQNAPFAKLQMVPTNAKPITSWLDRDDAFHDVTVQVHQVVSKLQTRPILLYTLIGHKDAISNLTISSDSRTLISGSRDKIIKIWELPSGQELHALPSLMSSWISAAISPDGKIFADKIHSDTDRFTNDVIKLWELPSGRELLALTGFRGSAVKTIIGPDNKILVTNSPVHDTIKIWEVPSGREIHTLKHDMSFVTAISADVKILVSGSLNSTIKLGELPSERELRTLTTHTKIITALAISPDGRILASSDSANIIKLWELPSGQELHTLTTHTSVVTGLAISPNGRTLASCSADKTIKLWELPSGQELHTLIGHMDSVVCITIGPDGKTLASGSLDKTIKLWKLIV